MRPNLDGLFSNSKISSAGLLPRWLEFDLGAFQKAHERPSRVNEPWHIEIVAEYPTNTTVWMPNVRIPPTVLVKQSCGQRLVGETFQIKTCNDNNILRFTSWIMRVRHTALIPGDRQLPAECDKRYYVDAFAWSTTPEKLIRPFRSHFKP